MAHLCAGIAVHWNTQFLDSLAEGEIFAKAKDRGKRLSELLHDPIHKVNGYHHAAESRSLDLEDLIPRIIVKRKSNRGHRPVITLPIADLPIDHGLNWGFALEVDPAHELPPLVHVLGEDLHEVRAEVHV